MPLVCTGISSWTIKDLNLILALSFYPLWQSSSCREDYFCQFSIFLRRKCHDWLDRYWAVGLSALACCGPRCTTAWHPRKGLSQYEDCVVCGFKIGQAITRKGVHTVRIPGEPTALKFEDEPMKNDTAQRGPQRPGDYAVQAKSKRKQASKQDSGKA